VAEPWDARFEQLIRASVPAMPESVRVAADLALPAFGLDSIGIVGLVAQLQEEYGVSLFDAELSLASYSSPGAIWNMLRQAGVADSVNR
jgi:acyl carrier protein